MLIREIQQQDNLVIERIIKAIFPEFGLPLIGTAYEDHETANMFESYQNDKEAYFVIEDDGKIQGGGGIKNLQDATGNICELQKMYFTPAARGKGFGRVLFDKCMMTAKDFGYSKCYLESASELKVAIKMYEKNGFQYLEKPLGNTGHYSCGVG